MNWNTPETAPKDKPILLDVGLPWPVVGAWSNLHEEWVYANYQIDMFDSEWIDVYFENEPASEIRGWLPLPEVA